MHVLTSVNEQELDQYICVSECSELCNYAHHIINTIPIDMPQVP